MSLVYLIIGFNAGFVMALIAIVAVCRPDGRWQ